MTWSSRESPELTDGVAVRQAWDTPSRPQPIVIIGAGAIVRTAHLPAYRRLRLPVAGIYDIQPETARQTARELGVTTVFSSLAQAVTARDTIFDVAVPGDQVLGVLEQLPEGAAVLIQKPMGEDLAQARAILRRVSRATPDRRGQLSVALQSERARAARSCQSRPARHDRGRRSAARRPAAVGDVGVHASRAAARGAVSLDSLSRHDPVDRRRASWRLLPRRGASGARRFARHAQLDHSRLRRDDSLLTRPQSHAPQGPFIGRR